MMSDLINESDVFVDISGTRELSSEELTAKWFKEGVSGSKEAEPEQDGDT